MLQRSNQLSQQLISIIIPAYKQEKTIHDNIKSVEDVLKSITNNYEIIVIVDGMMDKTFEQAKKLQSKKVFVYGYKTNQGKGHAVKMGVLKAKGDIIGFIDGGMDIDANGISLLLDYFNHHNADIVVGSKLHPDSEVDYPRSRWLLSLGYRAITKLLFNLQIKDTQVGLKLFKRSVAKDIFPRNLVKNFAFDVETLALARQLGYAKIYEAPIKLEFKDKISSITTTNFWKISISMLIETLGIFYRLRIRKSYRK